MDYISRYEGEMSVPVLDYGLRTTNIERSRSMGIILLYTMSQLSESAPRNDEERIIHLTETGE